MAILRRFIYIISFFIILILAILIVSNFYFSDVSGYNIKIQSAISETKKIFISYVEYSNLQKEISNLINLVTVSGYLDDINKIKEMKYNFELSYSKIFYNFKKKTILRL